MLFSANFLQTFGWKVWGVNDLLAQTSACMTLNKFTGIAHFKALRVLLTLHLAVYYPSIFEVKAFFCCPCIGFMGCQTWWHILEWGKQKRFHLQEMSLLVLSIYWIYIVTKLAIGKSREKIPIVKVTIAIYPSTIYNSTSFK